MTRRNAGNCDHGHAAPSCRLDLEAGMAVFLCRSHWATEMQRRRERNLNISEPHRFPVLPWPGADGEGEGEGERER